MTTPSAQAAAEQAERDRYLAIKLSVTAAQAHNMAALARENPALSPGLIYSAGRGGVTAGSAAAQALAQADVQRQSDKGGFSLGKLVTGAYRGAKKAGGALLPDIVGDSVDAAYPVVKGATRGAFGIGQAFGETIQATYREAAADGDVSVGETLNWQLRALSNVDETSIGKLVKQVKEQKGLEGLDTGSGFFLGGQVKRDQVATARAAAPLTKNGKAQSVGRGFAGKVAEPGSGAYNILSGLVDGAISLGADPTTYVGAPTKALQSRRLFDGAASKGFQKKLLAEAGAIDGVRKTVDSDRVYEWLTASREGQQVVSYLAKETDFARLWQSTGKRFDPKVALALTDTRSEDEVIKLIGPLLGRTSRTEEKFTIPAAGLDAVGMTSRAGKLGTLATAKFQRRKDSVRMFQDTPGSFLSKDNLGQSVEQLDLFLRNAKVDTTTRSQLLRRLAETDDIDQMFEVASDAMAAGAARAVAQGGRGKGVDAKRARELFRLYGNTSSDLRKYWTDYLGNPKNFGRTEDLVTLPNGTQRSMPHLAAEFLNSNVPLPDHREIRRAISPYRNLLNNPAIKIPRMALERINDDIFKPQALLRPAYITRVGLDEQFRPAGVGLASMFNHPVQYVGWLLSDTGRVGRALGRTGVQTGRGQTDATGRVFDEKRVALRAAADDVRAAKATGDADQISAARRRYAEAKDASRSSTPLTEAASEYTRVLEGGVGNWRNRNKRELDGSFLFQRTDDDYSRALGEELHLLFNDPVGKRVALGRPYPGEQVKGLDGIDGIKVWWWEGAGRKIREDLAKNSERMGYLRDRTGADAYIDDTLTRMEDATGGSPALRQAAATGRLNGKNLTSGDTLVVSDDVMAEIDRLKEVGEGPPAISGKKTFKARGETDDLRERYDKALDFLFYEIAARPSNFLARSPVFRQRYYKRLDTLIGFMTPAAQREALDGARAAKLNGKAVARLEAKAKTRNGRLSLEEADLVAKTDALEFTKELLYDLSTRNQFFDATRVIFPFGEAFKEAAKTYSRIVKDNPVVGYRIGQVVEAGRDLDPDGDGQGFFYSDEQTGQEMFTWPMSGLLGEQLGIDGFKSPLAGVNLLGTSVIPGFGPSVQIAAGYMLPDEPDFEGIRRVVSPFGERTVEGGVLESFLPAWFNKFRTALDSETLSSPAQQRAFAQAKRDVMTYLASTGKYDLGTASGQQALLEDATTRARGLFVLRGMAQSILPSPPSPEFVAYDRDGRLQQQFTLAQRYRELRDQDPTTAGEKFLEEMGEDLFLITVPDAVAKDGTTPVSPTRQALDFYRRNRKAAERYPSVFGLFAPDGGDFDYSVYDRQIRKGERVLLSPEDAVRQANARVAGIIYRRAKDKAGDRPSPAVRDRLNQLRDQLVEDYPGYAATPANLGDSERQIADVVRAAQDPLLNRTPAGKALTTYLSARESAERLAQDRLGTGWARSKAAAPIRERMRLLAEQLMSETPQFGPLYERLLEREMVDDDAA